MSRDALDRLLRPVIPDPETRRKAVDDMLRNDAGRFRPTTPTTPDDGRHPGIVTVEDGGLRYVSTTPVWFKMFCGSVPFNDHAPSGYGYWPYARAAARTHGRYLFYPFPPSRWLDVCPRDGALVEDLAPPLVPRARLLDGLRADPVVRVLARASALVFDETPWSDTFVGGRMARSWTAVPATGPWRLEKHGTCRRKPFDDALQGSEDGIQRLGVHLAEDVLPRYDQAIALLDAAVAKFHPGAGGVSPRSHADLLLTRFWLLMSAFHLHAYALYAQEVERFVPPAMKGHVDRIVVTYVPTIRMSDCLPAYDGRELGLDGESDYARWTPGDARGYQGNILDVPAEDPNYRARRHLATVLRYLDPRLRHRALRMIEAARDVMARYGRTGWGWTTYYSDAYTFVFKPVAVRRGNQPSHGGGRPPPRPSTPQGGGQGQGGSKNGGPGTGGK
jgi:hypothetical protein